MTSFGGAASRLRVAWARNSLTDALAVVVNQLTATV